MNYKGYYIFKGMCMELINQMEYKLTTIDYLNLQGWLVSKKEEDVLLVNVDGDEWDISTVILDSDEVFRSKSLSDAKAFVDIQTYID